MRPKMVGFMLCTMLLCMTTVGFGSDCAQTNKDPINIENVDVDYDFNVSIIEKMNTEAFTVNAVTNEIACPPMVDAPDVGIAILGNEASSYYFITSKNAFTSAIGTSERRHTSMSLCEKPKRTCLYRYSRE